MIKPTKANAVITISKSTNLKMAHNIEQLEANPLQENKPNTTNNSLKRYRVERTFGFMLSWFGSAIAAIARYVGLDKTHSRHVLESIADNPKRMPNFKLNS